MRKTFLASAAIIISSNGSNTMTHSEMAEARAADIPFHLISIAFLRRGGHFYCIVSNLLRLERLRHCNYR